MIIPVCEYYSYSGDCNKETLLCCGFICVFVAQKKQKRFVCAPILPPSPFLMSRLLIFLFSFRPSHHDVSPLVFIHIRSLSVCLPIYLPVFLPILDLNRLSPLFLLSVSSPSAVSIEVLYLRLTSCMLKLHSLL